MWCAPDPRLAYYASYCCVDKAVTIFINYLFSGRWLACWLTTLWCFVFFSIFPSVSYFVFLFVTVSFSLPLHSIFYSFRKNFRSTFTFFYFFFLPPVYLFNFFCILQADIFIYVIYVIHFYLFSSANYLFSL